MNSNSKIDIIQHGKKQTLPEISDTDTPAWFKWAMCDEPSSHFVSVKDCQIHYLLWDDANEEKNPAAFYLFMVGPHIPTGGAFGSLLPQEL